MRSPAQSSTELKDQDIQIQIGDHIYLDKYFIYKLAVPQQKEFEDADPVVSSNKYLTATHISMDAFEEICRMGNSSKLMQEFLPSKSIAEDLLQIPTIFKSFYSMIPNLTFTGRFEAAIPMPIIRERFT